jgi:glycerophosphoryl diester phosphodiesterase
MRASLRAALVSAALGALLCSGCGFLDAPGTPRVMAHRGGAGLWPENSRTAVVGTLERGFAGLEVDLVLTQDGVPVLSHDPALDPKLCTLTDGTRLGPEGPDVETLTLAQLQRDYRCGGLPNPLDEGAPRVAEPVLSLDELLALVRAVPGLELHLDIKAEGVRTFTPDDHARAVLERVAAAALPNPWYVTSNDPEMIRAFEARGEVRTQLSWPDYAQGANGLISARTELLTAVGLEDLVAAVQAAGADGVSTPYRLLEPHVADAARGKGLEVSVYTVDDADALRALCRLPVTQIITNHPEHGPCP